MKSYLLIWLLTMLIQHGAQQEHDHIEYAVEMDMDALEANLDLSSYNIEVIRKVSSLGNVYHLRHVRSCTTTRCKRDTSDMIFEILRKHPMIHRVEEQVELEVEQKFIDPELEFISDDRYLSLNMQRRILNNIDEQDSRDMDEHTGVEKKSAMQMKQDDLDLDDDLQYDSETIKNKKSQTAIPKLLTKDDKEYLRLVDEREEKLKGLTFNDPEAKNLWQYHNSGQFGKANAGMDMNLYNVYRANITGAGVVVTVIDDGLDTRSKEIQKNFDQAASLDLNDPRNKISDPRGPGYRKKIPYDEGHGTLCGATIAGEANNNVCAFGIAYNANLGGIRMLASNMVTDLLEAYALTHNNQYIDIYSNSWGPSDSGKKTSPTTYYAKRALEFGTSKGRNGKGSIYLFAAGNGGIKGDHCGADGFVNSPYTISVTAINIYGYKPAYTEECSAISISAAVGGYSSDVNTDENSIDPRLISAEVNNECKSGFMGTSAATPMIAGCIALAFEANTELNWRDLTHLFAISARIPNPVDTVWQLNTAGLLTSHLYGFGLLDCTAFVRNAQMWRSVGPLRICVGGSFNSTNPLKIRSQRKTRINFQTSACEHTHKAIDRLEHVLVHTKIKHQCRGDLTITLTSPTNTRSFLLKNRENDKNNNTISFSFLSLMNWGEQPKGKWYFDIVDAGKCLQPADGQVRGAVWEVVLEFHGTSEADSGIYKNRDLIHNYFKHIDISEPEQSTILSEKDVYKYFHNQRMYFIQLSTVNEEVIKYRRKLGDAKSSREFDSYIEKIVQLKNKIPDDEMQFLNSLLYNKKHNTL